MYDFDCAFVVEFDCACASARVHARCATVPCVRANALLKAISKGKAWVKASVVAMAMITTAIVVIVVSAAGARAQRAW